ncbi:MAG: bacterial regulatory s, tetR family protein [Propionibacteriaceae bacterium]|nr:bacterial regulatory s, tetR family protein [Propionibacteriaceae bacterium]
MSRMLDKYHHGDLRAAVLAAAAEVIARDGVDQLSLRSLAVELGVSHTAPRHHFGSREGVLTALACEGYELLADALEDAAANGDFAAVGVAYVLFAVDHAGHFAVMYRPELVDGANADLQRAQRRTAAQLNAGARAQGGGSSEGVAVASIAAWSLVHGMATLQLSGALDAAALPQQAGGDLPSIALRAVRQLFDGAPPSEPTTRTEN